MTVKKTYGKWIEWDGGECPVQPETLVEAKARFGVIMSHLRAGEYCWHHYGNPYDIISYRTVTEQTTGGEENKL